MDVFDLVAKISLDKSEYESGVAEARGSFSKLASGVGAGMKTLAKVGGAAVAAGAAGVAALTKMGVEGYAQYEQLVGGVETLFKESGDEVMKYAENAYKTSGLSANAYMETVTSFSASLIQSLDGDTAKAAKVADMAITDMADNANKMGTSIEMIQNAYNGFAKGNFTMLDNLKLGYGGTKEEMQRLLEDAEKISGIKYDISSFADISEAIHVVQGDLGIAGATAAEAASTIEGSLAMMKASWQNLVVGMADENADMESLINNFVDSTATAAQNLLPRIEQAMAGIGQLVEGLAPIIADKLPAMVESILPSLLTAAVGLITSVANSLPGLLNTLLPVAVEAVLSVVMALAETITGNIGTFLTAIQNVFMSIVDALPGLMTAICEALPVLIPQLIDAVVNMVVYLATNIAAIIQPLIDSLPDIIISIVDALMSNLPALIQGCVALVIGIVQALPQIVMALIEAIPTIIQSILGGLWDSLPVLLGGIVSIVAEVGVAIWDILSGFFTALGEWAGNLWQSIKDVFAPVGEWFGELFGNIWDGLVNIFTPVIEWFTTNISEPVKKLFTGVWDKLKNGASQAWEGIKSVFSSVTSWFGDVFSKAWQKVKDVFSTGGKVFDGIKEGIVSVFKTVVNAIIGGINKVIAVPFNAINDILTTIRGIEVAGIKPFDWVYTLTVPQIPKLSTGLNYVPFDEYPALLHRGEAVLTAAEARAWRNGQMTPAMAGGITINQYIQSVPQTPVELAAATEAYFEQARWML